MGRIRRKIVRIWKGENGVTATTTLFPHANSRSHLGTLSHLAPWNKPIHGLELFQFAAVSPVLPTRANTLDRTRHFELRTFLNRRHYRDVWYLLTLGKHIYAGEASDYYSRHPETVQHRTKTNKKQAAGKMQNVECIIKHLDVNVWINIITHRSWKFLRGSRFL